MKKEIPMAQQEAIIRKSKEGASIRGLVKEFSAINADITMSVVRRIINQRTDTPTQQRIPSTQLIDTPTQRTDTAEHRHTDADLIIDTTTQANDAVQQHTSSTQENTTIKDLIAQIEDVKKAKEKLEVQAKLDDEINEIIFKHRGYNEKLARQTAENKEILNQLLSFKELDKLKKALENKEAQKTQESKVTQETKEQPIIELANNENDRQIHKLEKEIADIKQLMFDSDVPNKMPAPDRVKHLENWNPDWPTPSDTEWLPFQLHKKTEALKRLKEMKPEDKQEPELEAEHEQEKEVKPFHLLPKEERLERLKTMTPKEQDKEFENPEYDPSPEEYEFLFAAEFLGA